MTNEMRTDVLETLRALGLDLEEDAPVFEIVSKSQPEIKKAFDKKLAERYQDLNATDKSLYIRNFGYNDFVKLRKQPTQKDDIKKWTSLQKSEYISKYGVESFKNKVRSRSR
jgi:hypothetical protein